MFPFHQFHLSVNTFIRFVVASSYNLGNSHKSQMSLNVESFSENMINIELHWVVEEDRESKKDQSPR